MTQVTSTPQLRSLGKTVTEFQGLDPISIATTVHKLMFISDEVTAICPVTGQPDLYTVTIKILPNGLSIESKSLKLYLNEFRNSGIFAENLAAEINLAVIGCVRPIGCTTTVQQKSRGGITLIAQARYGSNVPADDTERLEAI